MTMMQCPDILTIQAFLDGEEKDSVLLSHLKSCDKCRREIDRISCLICTAERLGSNAELPAGFFETMKESFSEKPFPAGLVAAVIFGLAILSAFFLDPAYFEWWLSVGITRQFSLFIDTFLELVFLGHSLGPAWTIAVLAALVVLEVMILSRLKTLEV